MNSFSSWYKILLVKFEGCRFVGKCAVVSQFPFVFKFLVNFINSGFIKTNEWKTDNTTVPFTVTSTSFKLDQ